MKCMDPIDTTLLVDYWSGALTEQQEDVIEVHVFGCEECSGRLVELGALAEGIRKLARSGSLRMVVSDVFLRRAVEAGLRIREYSLPAGGSVQCTVTEDDDLLIGRLNEDLSAETRIVVSLCDDAGVERLRLPDIPFHATSGSVAF
ncbi:MAG: hypothetical protein FJW38_23190 [Acidobacteria bacterium]|nr:hypothetical protein [Acidobacteriota bacterium]